MDKKSFSVVGRDAEYAFYKTFSAKLGVFQAGNTKQKLTKSIEKANKQSARERKTFLHKQKAAYGIRVQKGKAEQKEYQRHSQNAGKIGARKQKSRYEIPYQQPTPHRIGRDSGEKQLGTVVRKP